MSLPSFDEPAPSFESDLPRRRDRLVFDLPTARTALPLVTRVVADLVDRCARSAHQSLAARRLGADASADWETKKTLFRLQDEQAKTKAQFEQAHEELTSLGADLLDSARGVVGFPTIVNGSLAYLVYCHEEGDIRHWRYHDQPRLRSIPASWLETAPEPSEESEGLLV